MSFEFSIPTPTATLQVSLKSGASAIFVGANGGGKTRLAVRIEETLGLNCQRISAHRSLTLNPEVAKISEQAAIWGLRTGYANTKSTVDNRIGSRWGQQPATKLLDDFDFLLQALFAEQSNTSLETHNSARSGDFKTPTMTNFERLSAIWNRLLPHRKLHVSGDNIHVSAPNADLRYSASHMSDGERAIFYMVAQALTAEKDSLIIVDEPELHVHRSIMSKLWDELEGARQDCGFVFITHDLEFAASRHAQKFVIRSYAATPAWEIEPVPEACEFSEDVATLILGSRKPVLFVEGDSSSLDLAIYRCCYPDWTIIPRGSCEEVIHSVVTMRRNDHLTRVTCSGLVDSDDYDAADIEKLRILGIEALSVSEIENIVLLPAVSRQIALEEGYEADAIEACLVELKEKVFDSLKPDGMKDSVVARYCRRRIDRMLKKIDLSEAKDIAGITAEYNLQTAALNIAEIAAQALARIQEAIDQSDLPKLLANYDNKGLFAIASSHLKRTRVSDFESWLTRVLMNGKSPGLVDAIKAALPKITPR